MLVDMDGVLSDYELEFFLRWKKRHPTLPSISLTQRKEFDIAWDYPEKYHNFVYEIKSEQGFFASMKPIEGAKTALETMQGLGFEIFICTMCISNNRNCAQEKISWIEQEFGTKWVSKLIITEDKTIIDADILIDDKPNITGVNNTPSWEHILFDHPYNTNVHNLRRLNWHNWKDVLLTN